MSDADAYREFKQYVSADIEIAIEPIAVISDIK